MKNRNIFNNNAKKISLCLNKIKLELNKKSRKTVKKIIPKKIQNKLKENSPKIKKIVKSRAFYIVFSILSVLLLDYILMLYIFTLQFGNWNEAQKFITEKPLVANFSFTTILWISVLFIGIFRNWRISTGLLFSIATLIMYINTEKMASRNTPFLPDDLALSSEAGSLSSMINPGRFSIMLLYIAIIVILSIILNRSIKKVWKFKTSWIASLPIQAIFIISGIIILSVHTDFIRTKLSGKGTFIAVEQLGTSIDFTNQSYNYTSNGYILGTISNLQDKTQEKPSNYSKEAIEKIVAKYKKISDSKNSSRKDIKDEKVNIVYVMSESFIDPSLAKHIYDYGDKNPIPYTNEIREKQTSGWAASSEYGGGTANVEFEALTGLSNFFLNTIPYTSIVSSNPDTPSIVKTLNSNNYKTIALHPYNRNMYKRDKVYPNLGFNEYKSINDFKYTETIDNSKYVSDDSAFKQTLYELKNSKDPAFIHLVTMQNHMPYDENEYKNNTYTVTPKNGGNKEDAARIKTYLEGINKSDTAMKNFISELEKLDKKTIVVFWGDHWPGIYGEMFQKELNKNDIRRTPLFVYSNFDKEKVDLRTSSLNYNQITILDSINAKMSPYQYLISEVKNKYPALTKNFVNNNESSEALNDYKLIEYDILSGNKYSQGTEFYGY